MNTNTNYKSININSKGSIKKIQLSVMFHFTADDDQNTPFFQDHNDYQQNQLLFSSQAPQSQTAFQMFNNANTNNNNNIWDNPKNSINQNNINSNYYPISMQGNHNYNDSQYANNNNNNNNDNIISQDHNEDKNNHMGKNSKQSQKGSKIFSNFGSKSSKKSLIMDLDDQFDAKQAIIKLNKQYSMEQKQKQNRGCHYQNLQESQVKEFNMPSYKNEQHKENEIKKFKIQFNFDKRNQNQSKKIKNTQSLLSKKQASSHINNSKNKNISDLQVFSKVQLNKSKKDELFENMTKPTQQVEKIDENNQFSKLDFQQNNYSFSNNKMLGNASSNLNLFKSRIKQKQINKQSNQNQNSKLLTNLTSLKVLKIQRNQQKQQKQQIKQCKNDKVKPLIENKLTLASTNKPSIFNFFKNTNKNINPNLSESQANTKTPQQGQELKSPLLTSNIKNKQVNKQNSNVSINFGNLLRSSRVALQSKIPEINNHINQQGRQTENEIKKQQNSVNNMNNTQIKQQTLINKPHIFSNNIQIKQQNCIKNNNNFNNTNTNRHTQRSSLNLRVPEINQFNKDLRIKIINQNSKIDNIQKRQKQKPCFNLKLLRQPKGQKQKKIEERNQASIKQHIFKRQENTTNKILKNLQACKRLSFANINVQDIKSKQKNNEFGDIQDSKMLKKDATPKIIKIQSKIIKNSDNRQSQKVKLQQNQSIQSVNSQTDLNTRKHIIDYQKYQNEIYSLQSQIETVRHRCYSSQFAYKDIYMLVNKANSMLSEKLLSQSQKFSQRQRQLYSMSKNLRGSKSQSLNGMN